MASAKAAARYSNPKGSKKPAVPDIAEAKEEATATAGAPPKIDEGNVPEKVTKVGKDTGPKEISANGEPEMAEMHVHHRHSAEREEMGHRHAMEKHHMRNRHHLEHHHAAEAGERHGENLEKMHSRHHAEHRDMNTRHEAEMKSMHERHGSELAAPGEEEAERKPTAKPLSLVGGKK